MSLLTGCGSITVPAAGVTSTGERFTGSATASMSAGTFEMTGTSGNRCNGTYDQFSTAKRLSVPFTCTGGQRGTIDLVRDNDLMGGEGTATFTDGTTAKIQFGKKRVRA
ncbi:hypothetical protein [Neorhizobium petrolearium]|uniref:Lipoprotein n=1 Tax=Neorhizobium petrolearium TaxID=515361 RepID=A0ABY8M1Z3_9HYPH|nr:hypothetical protein [Neorhizobium petrolearium]MCC2612641.1 hypothetical protein [Neorhizobium petrolearium]WGI67764.1 hypothetical protein QEO92_22705 [Neorhizobium petrolearium]